VKIRLHGTEDECREAAARLGQVLDVLSVSDPYPDRGRSVLVRAYVEARLYRGHNGRQADRPGVDTAVTGPCRLIRMRPGERFSHPRPARMGVRDTRP
jgi:hypothetical protein